MRVEDGGSELTGKTWENSVASTARPCDMAVEVEHESMAMPGVRVESKPQWKLNFEMLTQETTSMFSFGNLDIGLPDKRIPKPPETPADAAVSEAKIPATRARPTSPAKPES